MSSTLLPEIVEMNEPSMSMMGGSLKLSNTESDKVLQSHNLRSYRMALVNIFLPGFWDNHVHFRGGDSLIQCQ